MEDDILQDVKGPVGWRHSHYDFGTSSSFALKPWEWVPPGRPQSHYPVLTLSFKRMALNAETYVITNGRGFLLDDSEHGHGQVLPNFLKVIDP